MNLLRYIKSRLGIIIFFIFMQLIFVGITVLADIPWRESAYAGLVQLFFALIIAAFDYYKFSIRVKTLRKIEKNSLYISEIDLKARDLIDEEYHKLYSIVHGELIRTLKEKESLEGSLNDYYKMWVHQIKTPLSALGLLVQNSTIEEKNEMKMELSRIESYLDMLLKFIKLSGESTDFVFESYNMEELVKEIVKSQSIVFIKKKLSVELKGLDENIVTDKKWLGFVIDQVLSNALKYTSKGGIVISMEKCDGIYAISIEDTGIGIRASDLSRIFEDGFTGYNGRTSTEASGIGLYLCRKITDKLGYRMTAESKLGEGSKISILIPFKNVRYE